MSAADKVRAMIADGKTSMSPKELAELIGGCAYSYNVAAREGCLGIPFMFRGNRLRISTAGVLKYLTGEGV